jgi:beta-ureidopropionase / N-carbamoyl-L-amino-acid hydrolase
VIAIDPARLRSRVETLARFGGLPGGGVTRPCWSPPYEEARAWLLGEVRAAGLEAWVDPAGNVFGATGISGFSAERPAVLTGSHIDTVPEGGILDGALGVLAGLEVLQTIREAKAAHRLPLAVAAWSDEEGRYGSLFGSRAFCGKLDLLRVEDMAAVDGERLVDAMARAGFDAKRAGEAKAPAGAVAAYVELHIEQGGSLDERGLQIGIVEGIVGIHHYDVTIKGFANHAGTTPMDRRRNAMLAAAELVLSVDRVVKSVPGRHVGTVGRLLLKPGAPNVIPGQVDLTVELRDLSSEKIRSLWTRIEREGREIAAKYDTTFDYVLQHTNDPALSDPAVRAVIADAVRDLGLSSQSMPSGAGHDAQDLARICPMGMIFVPSVRGISHSPLELTRPEDVENGANVLLQTVLRLDQRDN